MIRASWRVCVCVCAEVTCGKMPYITCRTRRKQPRNSELYGEPFLDIMQIGLGFALVYTHAAFIHLYFLAHPLEKRNGQAFSKGDVFIYLRRTMLSCINVYTSSYLGFVVHGFRF